MQTTIASVVGLLVSVACLVGPVAAQVQSPEGLREWRFVPDYRLPARAGAVPERLASTPVIPAAAVSVDPPAMRLEGMAPTDRQVLQLAPDGVPGAFYADLWLLDHVNRPVGASLAYRDNASHEPIVTLNYFNRAASVTIAGETVLTHPIGKGFKEYFYHLAISVEPQRVTLYVNGQAVASSEMRAEAMPGGRVELLSYLGNEPHMQTADLVLRVGLRPRPMSSEEVASRFGRLSDLAEQGILCDRDLHFTAGPVIQGVTQDAISFVWETSRPTSARLEWGTDSSFGKSRTIDTASGVQHLRITGLAPDTNYFYQLTAADGQGNRIDSGVLTFRTAVGTGVPVTFAVIGDTESRPHINHAISKLVWDQRPQFVLNVGDLSDGGQKPNKFQWTYEYFTGVQSLASRVPFYPVPGNGESDLHWYNAYHPAYGDEGIYSFVFGDAEFFMLDSNKAREDFGPGNRQYEWLKSRLEASDAKWKFVAHHHPTYTSDEDDYGNTWKGPSTLGDEHVRQILPLYEAMNVDMVFFGHLHTYERSHPVREGRVDPTGVVHVQAGGAGGHLEDFTPTRNWFSARTYRGHHYVMITLAGDTLSLRAYDHHGRMIDNHDHRKSR
jgi:hypothetical protein